MINEPRRDDAPIPALPERADAVSKPTETSPISASSPPEPPPISRLDLIRDRYEREVFDLVRDSLDGGETKDQVIETLKSHEFSDAEAREVVQAVNEDRMSGHRRRTIPSSHQKRSDERRHESRSHAQAPPPSPLSRSELAARDMAFGLLWLVGGIIMTSASYSVRQSGGVIFYGAVVWGIIQFLRGLVAWIGSRK